MVKYTTHYNVQSFNDCSSRWPIEPHWENKYGSFLHSFLLVQVQCFCYHVNTRKVEKNEAQYSTIFKGMRCSFWALGCHMKGLRLVFIDICN